MIKLNTPTDDDPALDQTRLLHSLRQTIRYAEEHGGIGLTQTKAFNRKFAHWGADNFDWPEYSTDRLLSIQKVLNECDVPPVGVIHDVLTIAQWGRHTKGKFTLSKSLTILNASFADLAAVRFGCSISTLRSRMIDLNGGMRTLSRPLIRRTSGHSMEGTGLRTNRL